MDNRRLDLGVAPIHAESFGEPGQRTFRLLIETPDGRVSLWLEKEQLVMLQSAIEEILQRVSAGLGGAPQADVHSRFSGDLEVRAGSLAIGYDPEYAGFTLEAAEFESPFAIDGIRVVASRSDFAQLGDEITKIVAGGRPRCPLCGTPLSGGPHFCPPSNGHAHIATPD